MRLNMSRIGNRFSRKTPRVRILRSWRGYPVGAVIQPPGGLRQILLQAHDQLGNKIAALVEEPQPVEQDPAVTEGDEAIEEKDKKKAKKK